MTNYRQLVQVLIDHEVKFIVIGGLAAIMHGSARLTLDTDVVYDRSDENVQRIIAALGPLRPYPRGAPPNLPFLWDAKTIRNGMNFTFTTTAGDLDILGEVTGGGNYDQLLPHTFIANLAGLSCRCVDLETLIHLKRAAGRPKDFDALAELEALREEIDNKERANKATPPT